MNHGATQPSARQLLAICEIFEIYDVYTEFIGRITQQQLADATGISVRTIISIKKGQLLPTLLSAGSS